METNSNRIILEVQKRIDTTPSDVRGEYSDGYHTFNELYEFRKTLHALLFNEWSKNYEFNRNTDIQNQRPHNNVHKSKKHHDGELCFGGGWFIVVARLPMGQITNHYKMEDWDLFKIPETEKAMFPFDGHTSQDVLERMNDYIKRMQ
ncbi:MAG: hypothetical protein AB8G11_07850 [Saprospiraceae bacterium]